MSIQLWNMMTSVLILRLCRELQPSLLLVRKSFEFAFVWTSSIGRCVELCNIGRKAERRWSFKSSKKIEKLRWIHRYALPRHTTRYEWELWRWWYESSWTDLASIAMNTLIDHFSSGHINDAFWFLVDCSSMEENQMIYRDLIGAHLRPRRSNVAYRWH